MNTRDRFGAGRQVGSLGIGCLLWLATGAASPLGEPVQSPDPSRSALHDCQLEENEIILSQLLESLSENDSRIKCHPTLQAFAEFRARDMATRGQLSHVSADHRGPNQMLRETGYPLPDEYRDGLANNVESIAGGIESPGAVLEALLASPAHRAHLLGEGPGFGEQDEYGVAYARNIHAPHVDYWVIVIARRARPEDPRLICTPAPATCFPVDARRHGRQPEP